MDLGTVLSVAQTFFDAVQNEDLKQMCSVFNFKSQLREFGEHVEYVKRVLEDADSQTELNKQDQHYIEELKDALYDADDLFDEFATRVALKHKKIQDKGKLPKNIHRFWFHIKELGVFPRMSKGVKEIEKRLDGIADRRKKFGLKSQPIQMRQEETCSYKFEQDVIGREDDKEKIVGMLLNSHVQQDVSFLAIVGMPGLGKTTLAQMVYNDKRIAQEFVHRLWTCVGDKDRKDLNVKNVISKILEAGTGQKPNESTLEAMQSKVRNMLNQKFLLVLDDIWNENRNNWLELENFFKGGRQGSWVVVTTRSWNVARVITDPELRYDLKGLSDEDSWNLFERLAFRERANEETLLDDRIQVGRKIVKKCVNLPLAIRVIGTLLDGKEMNEWKTIEKTKLVEVNQGDNDILPALKLSYHRLNSHLKSCFAYCALFPEDVVLEKDDLISLWIAQGYIVPIHKDQSIEAAGEQYFEILVRRCFLQGVKEDGIPIYKMHDLMRDVAQEVAGKEIYLAEGNEVILSDFDEKVHHVNVRGGRVMEAPLKGTKVRTALIEDVPISHVINLTLETWMSIRALQLCFCSIEKLPESIGKLLHLRYLDLSWNDEIAVLPKSFSKLHNLQTLKLGFCRSLKELPSDFSKLCNLRLLDIGGCDNLTHMPLGMGKLSCLCKLSSYPVNLSKPGYVEQLEGLKALTKLGGSLRIEIYNSNEAPNVRREGGEGGYLLNKPDLKEVEFIFKYPYGGEGGGVKEYHETLMEDMQLDGNNLMRLELDGYGGVKMPSWAGEYNLITKLESITLVGCKELQSLPALGELRHLRVLSVTGLEELKYMEDRNISEVCSSREGDDEYYYSLFPSLQELTLEDMPKLKGWWRGMEAVGDANNNNTTTNRPAFPVLSKLTISHCPELTSMLPLCPNSEISERLRVMGMEERGEPSSSDLRSYKLREMTTGITRNLIAVIPVEALLHLQSLSIKDDRDLESLEEVGEIFKSCSSSLRRLNIWWCDELKSIVRGGLEYLTALEDLLIFSNPNLSEDGLGHGEDHNLWLPLRHTLRSLTLSDLPQVVELPEGIRHLTSLQSLTIEFCKALKSLPEWMPDLTALTRLEVSGCSEELTLRCRGPSGSDWPYIQHIPHILSYHDNLPKWEWHR